MNLYKPLIIISLFFSLSFLEASEKLYFPKCSSFSKKMKFDCYRTYDEVVDFLKDANATYPKLCQMPTTSPGWPQPGT